MPTTNSQPPARITTGDDFDLERFVDAQENIYPQVLAELRRGRKQSHWMWFIFPQYRGLGASAMSQRYAIGSLAEARAYLRHDVLGDRLRECATAVLSHDNATAGQIFGSPDDMKLRSSATLFAAVATDADRQLFTKLIDGFLNGDSDLRTLELIESDGTR